MFTTSCASRRGFDFAAAEPNVGQHSVIERFELANGAPLALLSNDAPAEMGEPPHGLLPPCESSITSVGDGGHPRIVLHHTCR